MFRWLRGRFLFSEVEENAKSSGLFLDEADNLRLEFIILRGMKFLSIKGLLIDLSSRIETNLFSVSSVRSLTRVLLFTK